MEPNYEPGQQVLARSKAWGTEGDTTYPGMAPTLAELNETTHISITLSQPQPTHTPKKPASTLHHITNEYGNPQP